METAAGMVIVLVIVVVILYNPTLTTYTYHSQPTSYPPSGIILCIHIMYIFPLINRVSYISSSSRVATVVGYKVMLNTYYLVFSLCVHFCMYCVVVT